MSFTEYHLKDVSGRHLYIGQTQDLERRLAEHQATKPWWSEVASVETFEHETRAEAEYAERFYIDAFRPVHNVQHNPQHPNRIERRLAELCDTLDEMRRAPARRSLMRVRSVAHELDCTERHVRTLIASGALPAVRFGSESRVRATDLDAYLAGLPAVEPAQRHLEAVGS